MAQSGMVEIMDALAAQLRTVYEAVPNVDVQVEGRLLVNPTPPAIDVYPGDLFRDRESAAFDDISGAYRFTIRARVSTADTFAGQELLLAFMDDTDPLCMAAALGASPTLGGYAASVSVEEPTGYVMYPDPGSEGALLGCQWPVLVIPAETAPVEPPPEAPEMIFEDGFAAGDFAAFGYRQASCDCTLVCPDGTPDTEDPLDSWEAQGDSYLWRVTLREECKSLIASCLNACELDKDWPDHKLGETEYIAHRVRVNSPFTPEGDFCLISQFGYTGLKYNALGLNLVDDTLALYCNLGFSDTTANDHYHNPLGYSVRDGEHPVDVDDLHDYIWQVTYSTIYGTSEDSPTPGRLRVYHRKPETTAVWDVLFDSATDDPGGVPTRQWGYGLGNDVTMLVDVNGLKVADGLPQHTGDKIGAYRGSGNTADFTVDHLRMGIATTFDYAEAYLDLAD